MKVIKNEETGKCSLVDLTELQADLIMGCVDTIRRHLYYDYQSNCYRVDSNNVKSMYDEEEVDALQSLEYKI